MGSDFRPHGCDPMGSAVGITPNWWLKSLLVIGNLLATLGCWLEGTTLKVGRVPVTAGDWQGVPTHVGCMSYDCGNARVEGSCLEASGFQGQSVVL